MAAAHLKAPLVGYWPAETAYCGGKAAFVSPAMAQLVLDRTPHIDRQAYRCRNCGKWHLGRTKGDISGVAQARRELIRKEERP